MYMQIDGHLMSSVVAAICLSPANLFLLLKYSKFLQKRIRISTINNADRISDKTPLGYYVISDKTPLSLDMSSMASPLTFSFCMVQFACYLKDFSFM